MLVTAFVWKIAKSLTFICYLLCRLSRILSTLFQQVSDRRSLNHFKVCKSQNQTYNIYICLEFGISYLVKSWQLFEFYDVMTFDTCQSVNNILKMTYWPPSHYTRHTQLCNLGIYSLFTAVLGDFIGDFESQTFIVCNS